LQEFYGTVEWSVKAVFAHYMGWFSGNPSELHPLPPKEEAALLVDLAGGHEKVSIFYGQKIQNIRKLLFLFKKRIFVNSYGKKKFF